MYSRKYGTCNEITVLVVSGHIHFVGISTMCEAHIFH